MNILRTPKSMDLAITGRCNLRCKYCSHFTSAGDVNFDLPKEAWLTFFEELSHCAVFDVTLQGGEPFFREDLRDLIKGIVKNRMRFTILSNGTLVTENMASFLSSTGRCDGVQVSIDGSIPVTHDSFRGRGTFHKAIIGVKYLQKHLVPVSVRVTIHKHNVRDLDAIADLLFNDIGLDTFSTNTASYMGLCRQNAEMIQLTTEERSLAMETLLKLNEKYQGRINASAGPLAEAVAWREMLEAHNQGQKQMRERGYLTGCGGPMEKLAVRADGVMVPCIQLSHIPLGRVNENNLKEVWQNHPELKRLRERCNIPLSRFKFCEDCKYVDFCTGNCPALAYLILGEENHPSPDACLKRFLEEGGRLPGKNAV
jgi:SynChlorMet cassette radical SAM/SPASM protein ScmE